MDITKAQFADFNNTAGKTTFSYAQLLAQLIKDLPPPPVINPNIGKGVSLQVIDEMRNLTDNSANTLDFRGNTGGEDPVVHFDDLAFYSNSLPTQFTIPDVDPPITRIIAWLYGIWSGTRGANTDYQTAFIRNNFASNFSGEASNLEAVLQFPHNQNRWPMTSGLIEATTGDEIEFQLTVRNVGDNTTDFDARNAGLYVIA